MIRTQVQLTEAQADLLHRLSTASGKSMAALIRDGVDGLVERSNRAERWERALSVVGKYRSDGASVAEEHDRYLEEIYSDH
jgi:hypothetical protein